MRHVAAGSRIVIHGDYDVDGVCSTAVLARALERLGAAPVCDLPSRIGDGYGLSMAGVERQAAAGTGLLVTVDCGITAVEEVAHARALGVEVVVTDHHRPGERLPDCTIVHPALGGYPFPDLCAAGVAYKLAQALAGAAGADPATAEEDLDLVALATVCDVVPLVGENRRIVRDGLQAIARTRKPGLRALMRVASCDPGAVDAGGLGFRLGPADQRRGPDAATRCRARAAPDRATTRAPARSPVSSTCSTASARTPRCGSRSPPSPSWRRTPTSPRYVLAGEGWHPGVIGIVASRLVERHCRPCVLIALDGDGEGRGSGRSISAFDLHAALTACAPHLGRFGGHRMAAGFDIAADSVEGFRRDFVSHAARALTPHDLRPLERVDALAPGASLGLDLAEELRAARAVRAPQPARRPCSSPPRGSSTPGRWARRASTRASRSRAAAAARERGRVQDERALARRLRGRAARRGGAPGAQRVERQGRAPARAARAMRAAGGLVRRARRRARPARAPRASAGAAVHGVRRARGAHDVRPARRWGGGSPRRPARERRRRADRLRRAAALAARARLHARRPRPRAARRSRRWDLLALLPSLATPYAHVFALDPPPVADPVAFAAGLPGAGLAHCGWGPGEEAVARASIEARRDVRASVAAVYRALREAAPAALDELEPVLDPSRRASSARSRCACCSSWRSCTWSRAPSGWPTRTRRSSSGRPPTGRRSRGWRPPPAALGAPAAAVAA